MVDASAVVVAVEGEPGGLSGIDDEGDGVGLATTVDVDDTEGVGVGIEGTEEDETAPPARSHGFGGDPIAS